MATTLYGGIPSNLMNDPVIGPAQKLYTSKFQPPSILSYPLDVGAKHRQHSIVFKVFEIQPNKIVSDTINTISNISSAADVAAAAREFYEGTKKTLNEVAEEVTKKPDTNLGGVFNPQTYEKSAATIALYMPDSINFTNNSQYDNLSISKVAENLPKIVGQVATAITSTISGDTLTRGIAQRLGFVFNPQQQLMFEGIDFRSFDFSFTFTPRSAREAEEIQRIINTFREHSSPEVNNGAYGFFFTPPSVFEISFFKGTEENKKLPKIKRCVIETVDVNYAPNGWAAHVDGAPAQTTLQLRVKEIELVDKKDIKNGF